MTRKLNPNVVASQKLGLEAVAAIERKHAELDAHIAAMDALPDGSAELLPMALAVQEFEFELQDLWGFGRNAAMHTHWSRPKACRCDRALNDLMWTHGIRARAVRRDCPIFGEGGLRPEGVTFAAQILPGEADWSPNAHAAR